MILNVENTMRLGSPCAVFDADGREIAKAVYVDTETGEVKRFATKDDVIQIGDDGSAIVIEEVRKTPFNVVWIEK